MEWIKTDDAFPKNGERVLVRRHYYQPTDYWEVATWNDHYKVWDGEDGDDYFCDAEDVMEWLRVR